MKSKACLLFVVFGAFNVVFAPHLFSQGRYNVRRLTPDNGLASVQVRGIVQDKLGYIWIGSRNDVSRYDGYNFKTYKFDSDTLGTLYTGGISNLKTDRAGNVWVTGELLSRYDPNMDAFIHYQPNTRLDRVRSSCFSPDNQVIWFGIDDVGLVSFDTKTSETSHFPNQHSDSLKNALRNSIWGISDRDTVLLLATLQGLWKFDKTKKIFTRPKCDPKDTAEFYHQPIWELIEYPNYDPDDVWLSVGVNKMVKIDQNCHTTQRFGFSSGYPYTRESRGILWFYTQDGFLRYDPRDSTSRYLHSDVPDARVAGHLFVDREQTIWLGTESAGLYQLIPKKIQFHNFKFDSPANFVSGSVFQANGRDHLAFIRGMLQSNELWTAKPDLSVAMDSVIFQKAVLDPPLNGIILTADVGKNKLLAGSWNSGVMTYPIVPSTGIVGSGKMFAANSSDPNHIRPLIGNAYEDNDGNIWVASRGHGVSKVVNGTLYGTDGSVIHYSHNDLDSNSLGHNYTWSFYPEDEKSFWVVNWNGVDLFRNGSFEHVFKHIKGARSLLKISDDTLIIGTYNGLYEAVRHKNTYRLGPRALTKYTVYDMTFDPAGRLWFTDPLHARMVCYDRRRKVVVEFSPNDGFPEGVSFVKKTSKDIIVLGTTGGITLFDPLSLEISNAKTFPVLTQLKVNNQIASIHENSGDNSSMSDIGLIDKIVLDYQHNNFALEFSAMEMTSPDKSLYRYKLEDYDRDWIETDWKNRTATYTNLDAGEYVFKVKASNHHGVWSDNERTLKIRILPPPWKTWWAYCCYGLALAGAFVWWRRYDLKRVKLKHRAEHLSELDNLKTRFFTNISHEFRTPVTLIRGPLSEMYHKTTDEGERSVIGMMLRNVKRLARLINQLLDLSKLEAGKMSLHAAPLEMVQFLREIASSYESLAANKNITYSFQPEAAALMVYADGEKIEKVMHNLLSNALKFTKADGEVTVRLRSGEGECCIVVEDTGIGIPPGELDKIFDRFHQVDGSQTREYEGTGLGMALSKELVELHHGTITAESTEGKGTTFTVALPLGKDHLRKDELTEGVHLTKGESAYDEAITEEKETDQEMAHEVSGQQPILLVVEDNSDMRHYIAKTFAGQYQVIEARNGREGLSKAGEVVPDLIISDVMMPEIDGYKFCEQIKTNELTSHIPVILLTAKADRDSRLTGLETGADDYLSKPFDADELKLIVKHRIEQRRRLRERFSREITLEPKQISITSYDEKFLTKVMAIIENHIGDEIFSIDALSREVGYSNMHFYRKIKALAGETPSQFLRTTRLKRAAELLRAKSDNVTQIAYSVGFSSLSYFNKCFKEQFGVTPGQFAAGKNPKVKL